MPEPVAMAIAVRSRVLAAQPVWIKSHQAALALSTLPRPQVMLRPHRQRLSVLAGGSVATTGEGAFIQNKWPRHHPAYTPRNTTSRYRSSSTRNQTARPPSRIFRTRSTAPWRPSMRGAASACRSYRPYDGPSISGVTETRRSFATLRIAGWCQRGMYPPVPPGCGCIQRQTVERFTRSSAASSCGDISSTASTFRIGVPGSWCSRITAPRPQR